jgi:hypothetical protein
MNKNYKDLTHIERSITICRELVGAAKSSTSSIKIWNTVGVYCIAFRTADCTGPEFRIDQWFGNLGKSNKDWNDAFQSVKCFYTWGSESNSTSIDSNSTTPDSNRTNLASNDIEQSVLEPRDMWVRVCIFSFLFHASPSTS